MQDKKTPVFNGETTVVGMTFPDYLNWVSADSNFSESLFLPSIQRGFIWRPAQIVRLWDSLLRGMPIGSLLLNKLGDGELVMEVDGSKERRTEALKRPALGLLDGQQRTLAMLLGWPDGKDQDQCIWVDLGEDGHEGAPFELRISTRSQPFGFQRHTHAKYSLQERIDARNENADMLKDRGIGEGISDAQIFPTLPLDLISPWKGKAAHCKSDGFLFPLRQLWSVHQGKTKNEKLASAASNQAVQVRKKRLFDAFKHLQNTQIPLVLMPDLAQSLSDNPANDPLILLFERISTGGTTLTPEELLYSMIKRIWPEAHDLVKTLHESKVQHLLSVTGFVMAAFRLGVLELKDTNLTDVAEPGPREFHARLSKVLGTKEKPGPLRQYLDEDSRLKQGFDSFYELVKLKNEDGDKGIPDLMMPHLPSHLIHVLIYWIMKIGSKPDMLQQSRGQVLAFILFWCLCARNHSEASRKCIETLAKTQEETFPGRTLYTVLTKINEVSGRYPQMCSIFLPAVFNELEIAPSPVLRSLEQRMKKLVDPQQGELQRELFEKFWWAESLLIWFQRAYLSKKYKDYNALAGKENDDTVPYDYDHLCPKNEWRAHFSSLSGDSPALSDESREAMSHLWRRDQTGNSIGNLHILDASDNRSAGNDCFPKKIQDLEKKSGWCHADGALPDADIEVWRQTASLGDKGWCWTAERVTAFQQAVDRRVLYLYGLYYEAVKEIVM